MNGGTAAKNADDGRALAPPVAPAPWSLEGRGLIVALRSSPGSAARGPALLILADYLSSTVGPYGEVVFMPGRCLGADGRRHLTIPRIVVTTEPAMRGGRANWGVPKTQVEAEFAWHRHAGEAAVRDDDGLLADVRLSARAWSPSVPITTALLPGSLHRFEQELDGRRFRFTPAARGRVRFAKVERLTVAERFQPGLHADAVLGAVIVPRFRMEFPAATTESALPEGSVPER